MALWWPSDLDRVESEPAEVTFTRTAVSAIEGFRTAKEAGASLAAVYRFACWLNQERHELGASSFSAELISAYREVALDGKPRGTQDATCSRLRQVGEALRTAGPDEDETARSAVQEVVETFVPRQVSPTRFEVVESVVRDAVRRCRPLTVRRAQAYVRDATYLACWADETERSLRIDVVFHPATVEEFGRVLSHQLAKRSAATITSTLRTMSGLLLPGVENTERAKRAERVRLERAARPHPYVDEELALLARDIEHCSTKRRRDLHALMHLGLGAGLQPGEGSLCRPADVVRFGDDVFCTLVKDSGTVRRARVLEPHGTLLFDYARQLEQEGAIWLLGGTNRRANRLSELTETSWETWTIPLEVRRLRATYLVALAREPHTISDFMAEAGVTTLGIFNDLLDHLRDHESAIEECA